MSPERWKKIEAVFQSAIDLPAGQRDKYLNESCGPDLELRSEVEKLLRSSDAADDFIEAPIWTDSNFLNSSVKKVISSSLDGESDGPRFNEFIGSRIGVYRLVSEIGRGGMGAVFLAERDDGEFAQKVAIKLIKRGMDSDFIVKRFRHERQILASFEHPYIARLLDGGSTGDGVPYFVMEYIEGQTLYHYCDNNRLDLRARLKLFQKICSALSYAHERQIIHRDIKPGNILINKYGNPKLLDFGIAKVLDPNLIHESVNPTASVMRMMTPDYASPEQVKGDEITEASDIYSMGILLYELLTGHKPYNFSGRALHEVSRVVCEVMPRPPSQIVKVGENLLPQYTTSPKAFADVRSSDPDELATMLRGSVDNIVMNALAKQPGARYESVKTFSEDITRFMGGRAVKAPPYVVADNANGQGSLPPPSNTKALAILPFRFLNLSPNENTDDHFLGLGLADALISRLSKLRKFVVRPTSSIVSFGSEVVDPIQAGRDLNVDFILDGNIKKSSSRLRLTVQLLNVKENAAIWATSIDEVVSDVFALEDTLSTKLIEVLLPQLTGSELEVFSKRGTDNPEAFEHYLRGRYHFNTFTEDGFAKAFLSFHTAIAADPGYAHAYAGIADYYNWLGIMGVLPPLECFQPAIDAASRAVELDPELSEAHASLGFSMHAGNHDWVNAENHLRRAIELNPGNANAYVWYSIVLFTEGRFTDGLEFARRSVELDPLTPFNHHNIGWGLYYARRFDEAIAQYKRVTTEFPEYVFGYYGLSKIHRITGETKAALEESAKVRQLMDNSVFSLLAEAECLAADGQKKAAEELLQRLCEMSKNRYVSPYQLALTYCFLGDTEGSFEQLQKAADINEAWLNWLPVEPAFDIIRKDKRYDKIVRKFGYHGFVDSSSPSRDRLDTHTTASEPSLSPRIHNLTTLMIDEGHRTDGGAKRALVETRPWYINKGFVAALVLFSILVVSALAFWPSLRTMVGVRNSRPANVQNASIVVLPFKGDSADTNEFGFGVSDALSSKLGNIKSLQVISAGRSSSPDPIAAGNQLGASFVLHGELKRTDGNLRVQAQLTNVGDESTVWTQEFPVDNGDLFAAETRLAKMTWSALGIEPLPLELQQINKSYTSNTDAYNLYLLGRYQMAARSGDSLRKAIETFQQSLSKDNHFALAHVGLADAYGLLNLYDIDPPKDAYPKAFENATKALAIDDNLGQAHASLAYVKYYHHHDMPGAELEFRRAIQLNPSYAQAHHWFALALAGLGRSVEALTEAQIAQRLDPHSPSIKAATGIVYFMSRRYDEAIAECDKALEINDQFVPALKVKRWVYTTTGNRNAAIEAFEKEMRFSGGSKEDAGWRVIYSQILPSEGERAEYTKLLEDAITRDPVAGNDFTFAYEIALAYNALGNTARALDWLERAAASPSHGMTYLTVDPRLDNLKSDRRFNRLSTRNGSPAE